MNVLMWFRQDLRIHDHAALGFAAGLGAVVPIYIFDPEVWAQPDRSARQFQFICESLDDLSAEMAQLGVPLLIRTGPTLAILQRISTRYGITHIVTEAAAPAALADWARSAGIEWSVIATPQQGETLPPPALRAMRDLVASQLPAAQMLRLAPDPCAHRQRGGRSQALDLLDSFLTTRAEGYHHAQSQPLVAERASSRLSPHLTQGVLSNREINAAVAARLAERPGGRWGAALSKFRAQLDLRAPANAVCGQRWDDARVQRWISGETGMPFLDACMRYLAATGWLNHHLRGFVLGLGCHYLALDWQAASTALAARLTDYDPALFWREAQNVAGFGAQAPRLLHPVKHANELDPTGAFTRRWVPELAAIPDSCLQTPWRWAGAARLLGRRYPEPMVDIETAHRDAREAIWARHGRPMRAVTAAPLLIETHHQPAKGQLRLEF